jgi:DNA-binding transcriptional MerR regulator
MNTEAESLTLDELAQEVAGLIKALGLQGAQSDQRVSTVPDARTIRYYTTLGLLDRPVVEGRQARYGRKQVLQLLAIKGMQGLMLPLSQIQSKLYGLNVTELEAVIESIASSIKDEIDEVAALPRAVLLREIEIEPGLKLVAHAGFTSSLSADDLRERLELALKYLNG